MMNDIVWHKHIWKSVLSIPYGFYFLTLHLLTLFQSFNRWSLLGTRPPHNQYSKVVHHLAVYSWLPPLHWMEVLLRAIRCCSKCVSLWYIWCKSSNMYALFFSAFSSQCQRIPKRAKHISHTLLRLRIDRHHKRKATCLWDFLKHPSIHYYTRDVPELKVKQRGLTHIEWAIN